MAKKQEEVIPASDNVDQIREILFGSHIKDYDQRFKALEHKLEQAQERINAAFNKRLDTLNEHLEALRVQLKNEQTERRNGDESLDGLLQNHAAEIARQIDSVEAQAQQQGGALSESLEALGSSMGEQIAANREAINDSLGELDGRLSEQNVSRKELATLLGGLAGKLEAQPKPKKSK